MFGATTIVVRTSGTDPATIILAALGVGLALASLGWQARTFLVSGSRVSTTVKAGLMGMGGVVTMPSTIGAQQLGYLHSQGYTEPVFAVEAYNKGRGSTSIVGVDLLFDDGGSVGMTQLNPPLPFKLEGESAQTWYIDAQMATAYARASGKSQNVRGRVELGSKQVITSKNRIPVPSD